jgi:hypothetical protein
MAAEIVSRFLHFLAAFGQFVESVMHERVLRSFSPSTRWRKPGNNNKTTKQAGYCARFHGMSPCVEFALLTLGQKS